MGFVPGNTGTGNGSGSGVPAVNNTGVAPPLPLPLPLPLLPSPSSFQSVPSIMPTFQQQQQQPTLPVPFQVAPPQQIPPPPLVQQQPFIDQQQAEQQKLLMQVLSMTPEQIQALPLDQRTGVLQLVYMLKRTLRANLMLFVAQPPATPPNRYVSGAATSKIQQEKTAAALTPGPTAATATVSSATTTTTSSVSVAAPPTFRRSFIICQNPLPQQQQQQQSFLLSQHQQIGNNNNNSSSNNKNNNNSNNNCDQFAEQALEYKVALEKSQSRVASLERTVEFLQSQHRESLGDLHREIERLQNLCSDTQFADVFLDDLSSSFDWTVVEEEEEMKAKWFKDRPAKSTTTKPHNTTIATAKNPETTTTPDNTNTNTNNDLIPTTSPPTSPLPTTPIPYHLLLHQQRRKYQTFIERMNADNKRKQSEIDSLRAELELVRDVLAVSGLDVDLIQLRSLVGGKEKARDLMARAKKVHVLPPINDGTSGGIDLNGSGGGGNDLLIDAIAEVPAGVILDSRNFPRFGRRFGGAGRKQFINNSSDGNVRIAPIDQQQQQQQQQRPKHKTKDFHNANLDYQGRAHLYSVPPETASNATTASEGVALSAESTVYVTNGDSGLGAKKDLSSSSASILPPISFVPGHHHPNNRSLLEKADAFAKVSTSWTKRLKGTQMLRNANKFQ
ncbi:hypothetical protein HK100_006923 [Physocladia obscura]|uniref:Uncharacterized protein n=1 Tax=Physocladia obscura TaxID=109957 RepID=A0AAD5T7Q8_9FUNG|nr:hypothetical protein HK100_006923 [Physocladia obscura]